MLQLVRNTEDERKDLISLADALRECSGRKRHFSSSDEKLCNDGAGAGSVPPLWGQWYFAFINPDPCLRGQFSLQW